MNTHTYNHLAKWVDTLQVGMVVAVGEPTSLNNRAPVWDEGTVTRVTATFVTVKTERREEKFRLRDQRADTLPPQDDNLRCRWLYDFTALGKMFLRPMTNEIRTEMQSKADEARQKAEADTVAKERRDVCQQIGVQELISLLIQGLTHAAAEDRERNLEWRQAASLVATLWEHFTPEEQAAVEAIQHKYNRC